LQLSPLPKSPTPLKAMAQGLFARHIYVDTSVWVALLANEPGSPALQDWLETETAPLCTAQWTLVEVSSALSIKVRRAELGAAQAHNLLARFTDLLASSVANIPVAAQDFERAAQLCSGSASGLRSGDALHLAVATRIGAGHMKTLDKVMAQNAGHMGMRSL
jgi:predicted nucleic acid-binding protein